MATPLKGSCLCGKLRFEVSAEPLFQAFCQCLDCRKVSGGHYAALGVPSPAVKVTGEKHTYGKPGNTGKTMHRTFCPTCGSVVFDTADSMPGVTIVNAALLDDPELFKPQRVVYARSALSWDHIDPKLPRFQTLPPQQH